MEQRHMGGCGSKGLWEQGLPAMNDNAVQLLDRGATIAGKPCSHRQRRPLYQVSTAPTAKVSVSSFWALVSWPLISNWLYSATSLRLSLMSWNSAMPRVS